MESSADIYCEMPKCVPPEAANYDPPHDVVFFMIDKKHKHRRIFAEPQQFEPDEEEECRQFQAYLDANDLEIPPGYTIRDAYKHIIVAEDFKEAYETLKYQYDYLNKIRPVSSDGIEKLLNSGIFYFLNRDRHFRPILILNLRRAIDTKYTDDELIRLSILTLDYCVENCMWPGKIENWLVIVDAKDVGITQIPRKKLKPMVEVIKNCYRGRLYKFIGVNVTFMLRVIWKLVKSFVDSSTQKQMEVYGTDFKQTLLDMVDEDKLEEKYGGTLPNKETDFFPPQLG